MEWHPGAVADLKPLSVGDRNRARSCSVELKENPYNHQTRQLEGVPFRRVVFGFRGDKRMIYTVDDHMKLVVIYAVGDRRTIYERLPGIAP